MITLNDLLPAMGLPTIEPTIPIKNINFDSRCVKPGDLFVAIPGNQTNGCAFIEEAAAKGASAIVMPSHTFINKNHSFFPVYHDNPRLALSFIAASVFPKQPHHQIVVTGTNGKTSTVDFIRQMWEFKHLPTASIGTLGVVNNVNYLYEGPALTTPDSLTLHRILNDLIKHHVQHVAIEASSHGLSQFRLENIVAQAAGFTNLTRDHLDYHGSLDNYFNAKLRLFNTILPEGGIACINADIEPKFLRTIKEVTIKRKNQLRLVGKNGQFIKILNANPTPYGQDFKIMTCKGEQYSLTVPLLGRYQLDNILLALSLITSDADEMSEYLPYLPALRGVKGRLQQAALLPNGAAIYVDYAHTPDALSHVLQSLRSHTQGELYIVFGAGGDRDKGKRPLMGKAAAKWADHLIITDDNPRTENADHIRKEIKLGCETALEIPGREKAIAEAIKKLKKGDILVVAGKGHEQGQTIGHKTYPFDDVKIIQHYASNL